MSEPEADGGVQEDHGAIQRPPEQIQALPGGGHAQVRGGLEHEPGDGLEDRGQGPAGGQDHPRAAVGDGVGGP